MAAVSKAVSKEETAPLTEDAKGYALLVAKSLDVEKASTALFDECVDAVYTALSKVKSFEEFRSVRASFVRACVHKEISLKTAENKISSHIASAKSKLDLVVPREAASEKRAKERAVKMEKALTAAIVSGIGDVEAQKKIERLAKSDDKADKALASAVLKATQVGAAAREATKAAKQEAEEYAKAVALIAKRCGVSIVELENMISSLKAKAAKKAA